MKHQFILFSLLLPIASLAYATEQESDVILYQGARCQLETHWLFPTPLQAYFAADKSREYPFPSESTANWRGHIATWEIADGRLYLVELNPSALPGLDISDEKQLKTQAQATKKKLSQQMKTIFAGQVDADGKIPARWYSGHLRVFCKPEKKKHQHQDDKTPREVVEFTEIALLQIKDGVVTKETRFPLAEYWNKFEIMRRQREIKPQEAAAINEHLQFLDQAARDWEKSGDVAPKGPLRTEADFPAFLTRQIDYRVRIPLTTFTILKDTSTDLANKSWTSGSDLRIKPGTNLLMLEMGSTNVPAGPWSAHTGGAIQVIVQLGRLETKQLTFTEASHDVLKQINNYGGHAESKQSVQGSLQVELSSDGKVLLTGSIRLTSKDPTTFQEIVLDKTEVPLLSIRDFLKAQDKPDDLFRRNAEEAYKEVLEKSKVKP